MGSVMVVSRLKRILKAVFNSIGYEIRKIQTSQPLGDVPQSIRDRLHSSLVKLHIGCGPRVLKGWINIDISYEHFGNYMQFYTDKFYPAEIRGDQSDFLSYDVTRKALPLPDSSVDVIFHEDFLEHLCQRDQVLFLAETCRVLKPGCVHRVNTPCLLSSMRGHSDFSKGYAGVYVAEWNKHGHLSVLTPKILEEMALMCGYSEVVFTARDQSISKLIPDEYRPDPKDRPEDGNIFADLIK